MSKYFAYIPVSPRVKTFVLGGHGIVCLKDIETGSTTCVSGSELKKFMEAGLVEGCDAKGGACNPARWGTEIWQDALMTAELLWVRGLLVEYRGGAVHVLGLNREWRIGGKIGAGFSFRYVTDIGFDFYYGDAWLGYFEIGDDGVWYWLWYCECKACENISRSDMLRRGLANV